MYNNNGVVEKFWLNNSMLVFKKNNLVYIATLKCGHTFYSNIVRYNKWNQINFNDIDWDKDRVCGFIMNPVTRYLKGLTQDMLVHDDCIDAVNTLNKYSANGNWVLLSPHSEPLCTMYQKRMYNIDWIPLDATPNSEFFFKKICDSYGINLDIPQRIPRHTSSPDQLKIFDNLKQSFGDFSGTFYRTYSTDIDLHTAVISNFNPNGKDWNEISWLKK